MNYIVPGTSPLKFYEVKAPAAIPTSTGPTSRTRSSPCTCRRSPTTESVHRNEVDLTVEPVALAAYNGTGSRYPFTCP